MQRIAVDAEANVRIFLAGCPASERAAADWIGLDATQPSGVLNVLAAIAEMEPPARDVADQASVRWLTRNGRAWLAGDETGLKSVFAAIGGERGNELAAALDAFQAGRRRQGATSIVGVLNVTPDSFSDGGRFTEPEAAVERGLAMAREGAGVIDVGGESTRPGAAEVSVEEELGRVLPVVRELARRAPVPVSIDTRKARVARACLDAGARWVNDVSGLTHDPDMLAVVAARPETRLVLMHSLRPPGLDRLSTEYIADQAPRYEDVVADTISWLRRRVQVALAAGIQPERLWIDPGFGFGKTPDQNVDMLIRLREYTTIGLPVLIGTSRKSTVGRLLGDLPPGERLEGTAATVALAIARGAAGVRVHDVREMARVARVADALRDVAR